jgi:hypothetical protein
MKRSLIAVATLVASLAACEGFKEAMTAHVEVAASAGPQQLSVERLGQLLSHSKVPVTGEIARSIASLWVDYQLLGQAAARGDSLNDPKRVDEALWPIIAQQRLGKWHEQVARTFEGLDTTNLEARYNQGEFLAARHILFTLPPQATPAQRDSIRRRAEAVRAQATSANFAELARQNSQDPGSAARGGDLGLFPKGVMVKEFQDAILALKPGQISPVVQTQFGYHIIRRSTYDEVKDDFLRAVNEGPLRRADSVYLAKLEAAGDVRIRDNAVGTVRAAAKDFDAHLDDDAVIATSKAGNFTVGRLARWISVVPQKLQIEQGLQQVPDSQVVGFIKSVIRNELVLRQADSAKVEMDSADLAALHARFAQVVANTWDRLGVSPGSLADSATTQAQRERVAAVRIDEYLDRLLDQQAPYVEVAPPVESVLRATYPWKINQAGLDRAVERAAKERAAADSARIKNRPPSEVPLGAPQSRQKAESSGAGRNR